MLSSYPDFMFDSNSHISAKQTCLRYAIKNDRVEIAELIAKHGKIQHQSSDILSYLFDKHKSKLMLISEMGLITDVSKYTQEEYKDYSR